uniref:Uncharacterized protein n=1 Tax=Capra hircus TaxID=9925 RepID=A0A8C2RFI8_CAPHI
PGRLFFGNLMGVHHVMALGSSPAACFLKCFNKGSLNVLCCPRVSSPHITSPRTVFYHMYTWEVKNEKSKRKIPLHKIDTPIPKGRNGREERSDGFHMCLKS